MICWIHLMKRDECPCCDLQDLPGEGEEARAAFFKALVVSALNGDLSMRVPLPPSQFAQDAVTLAKLTMSEIERRVEAGALFGGGGREEGA